MGSVPGIQIAHAGRKASSRKAPWKDGTAARPEPAGWVPVAPIPSPTAHYDPTPRALSEAENPAGVIARTAVGGEAQTSRPVYLLQSSCMRRMAT